MERWNELIAGYVLGNLTDEEHQELVQLLAENPRLVDEITRLRGTATLKTLPLPLEESRVERSVSGPQPDKVSRKPSRPTQSAFSVAGLWRGLSARSKGLGIQNTPIKTRWRKTRWPQKTWKERLWKKTSWSLTFQWLVILVLIIAGIDNWRVRKLLSIAQERISQLEALQ